MAMAGECQIAGRDGWCFSRILRCFPADRFFCDQTNIWHFFSATLQFLQSLSSLFVTSKEKKPAGVGVENNFQNGLAGKNFPPSPRLPQTIYSALRQMAIRLTISRLTMKPLDFSHELNRLMDPYWRKARIAARLLIKRDLGKPWSARDRRLAERLAEDNGVTNRLLDQAISSEHARKKYGTGILGWFN